MDPEKKLECSACLPRHHNCMCPLRRSHPQKYPSFPAAIIEAQSPKLAVNKHLKSYTGKMRSKGSKTQTVPFASLHCLKIIESFSIPICFKYFQIVIRVKVVNTNRKSSALEVGRKKVTCYSFSILFTFSFHIFQFHLHFHVHLLTQEVCTVPFWKSAIKDKMQPHQANSRNLLPEKPSFFVRVFSRQNSLNWTMEFKDTTINKPHTSRNSPNFQTFKFCRS